jgi:hypothetical protein
MPDERRYRDAEVKEIFDRASRSGGVERSDPTAESGLTLAELQDVGREVGLEPARIAEAASALERKGGALPSRRLLGLPLTVGRVVDLPRAPTDHEWELLVAELRTTFGAKGAVASSGSLREWSNGNLHAFVEPTEHGYRLRLGSLKRSARAAMVFGALGIGFGLLFLGDVWVRGLEALGPSLVFALSGVGAIASTFVTLPRWAREREGQMEHIAERATRLLAGEPGGSAPGR